MNNEHTHLVFRRREFGEGTDHPFAFTVLLIQVVHNRRYEFTFHRIARHVEEHLHIPGIGLIHHREFDVSLYLFFVQSQGHHQTSFVAFQSRVFRLQFLIVPNHPFAQDTHNHYDEREHTEKAHQSLVARNEGTNAEGEQTGSSNDGGYPAQIGQHGQHHGNGRKHHIGGDEADMEGRGVEGADEVFDRSGRLRQQQCRCQCRCEFQVSGQVSNKKEQGSYGAYEVDGGEHYARRAGHVAQGKEYAE